MPVNASTDFYDKTVDRAAMIRLFERRLLKQLLEKIGIHSDNVQDIVKTADVSTNGQHALKASLDREYSEFTGSLVKVTQKPLLDLATDQLQYTYQNFQRVMGDIWRTERPTRRVAEELVLTKPLVFDQTLEQGWATCTQAERVRIEKVIREGISYGKTPDEIAKSIRASSATRITQMQAKALAITAMTSVHAQADHEVFKANAKALNGWQYVAVLDSRTTHVCAARDGKIFGIGNYAMLPPAHFHCRSTTIPVFKSWGDVAKLEGAAQVRKSNLQDLTKEQIAYYDGATPLKESYHDWLMRQSQEVQLRHLGDQKMVEAFQSGAVHLSKFSNPEGNHIGIRELRQLTDQYALPGDTLKFANARMKLDAMPLGATHIEDFYNDQKLANNLVDYYLLQAGDLEGQLSVVNYRGITQGTKKATKTRVLNTPPTEAQLVYNPFTKRYDDVRMYQPSVETYNGAIRRLQESSLKQADKEFILDVADKLGQKMSMNQITTVVENLRVIFTRQRAGGEPWANFKAVVQAQLKFDIQNVSDAIETTLRKDVNVLKKLNNEAYIDPVLGATQLQEIHDTFIPNILAKNDWEDRVAPKIASELRDIFDYKIPLVLRSRLSDRDLQAFYLRFANRLALADGPDRDQFAIALGRDLYNSANINGNRTKWYEVGMELLNSEHISKMFEIDTYGVQKRRMKSRMSGSYFGPYYDTQSFNIRVTDQRVLDYSILTRKVELGLRVANLGDKPRLIFREGFKTYFVDRGILGLEDTRIPVTSTSSFGDFPEEFMDKNMVDALNWASKSRYRIDEDFYDFTQKLLYFRDDKGKAELYDGLNEYKHYISSRGDAYERFKSMQWLRSKGSAFSNMAFIDHRARIYDRGLISPQSGESFRPFLNTEESKPLGVAGYKNFRDQIGAFLGGLEDFFEQGNNSLTVTGRQAVATLWQKDLIDIGNLMLDARPNAIRKILEHPVVQRIEGEELGKFFRFAIEAAKIDRYMGGDYSDLSRLEKYKTALALEQDASSSGAQIIAMTTKNKQLAEMSNVVPTQQKRRLYDEIANSTFNDPRFRALNERLGLSEKDLRKAAKAQNMVIFYGAGERTGILNVEGKLGKVLEKQGNTLVVKASDRDKVLEEISARAARYQRYDPEMMQQLKDLRQEVRDIFNKGEPIGDEIMSQLYFLDAETKAVLEKMSHSYNKVVTPDDFRQIAKIMSEYLEEQVPILKNFTKFFGRLAEDFLGHAKPSDSALDFEAILKEKVFGSKSKGYTLSPTASRLLGLKAGEPLSEKLLKRLPGWLPGGNLSSMLLGVAAPKDRAMGFKVKVLPGVSITVFAPKKLPKSWTNVPWVNFDGKVIEQNFTQTFEEPLRYKDANGNWVTNIIQVPQKTSATWWEELMNESGKINDIADASKARTAFAVNGNHSNDATIVKRYHLWGRENNIATSTIHDAFFANTADMLKSRSALRKVYAESLKNNVILNTLNEMLDRGLPREIYEKYLNEAIDTGLIPVPGRSVVGGKVITIEDILTEKDILKEVPEHFDNDNYWYGVG